MKIRRVVVNKYNQEVIIMLTKGLGRVIQTRLMQITKIIKGDYLNLN